MLLLLLLLRLLLVVLLLRRLLLQSYQQCSSVMLSTRASSAYRIAVLWLRWLLVTVTRLLRRVALRMRVVAVALLGWPGQTSAMIANVSLRDHCSG